MKKIISLISIGLMSLIHAEEFGDTFKIRAGGYLVSHNETTVSATTDYLVGAKINLQDDLGMDTKTDSFRLDGHYRFNDHHKIEFSYYRIHTDSTLALDEDLEWDGDVYQAGATISSMLNMDIYKLNYAYSFYHSKEVELSLAAGLHMMDIETGLQGDANVNNGGNVEYVNGDTTFLAPLPVIGFRVDYAVTPRFHIAGAIDYFGISIDQYSGSFVDLLINAEYQAFDNFGVGAGLNVTSLEATVDDGTEYELNQNISGFLVYLSYNY